MKPRDNPFASHIIGELPYRFAGGQLETIIAALERASWRGAIVGDHGSGKSTLLNTLQVELAARDFETAAYELQLDRPRARIDFAEIDQRTILLIDGADQIPSLLWFLTKLRAKRGAGLIVTSHRPGLLETVFECRSSPQGLAKLIAELSDTPQRAFVEELYSRHGGNMRDALREMYDRCAQDDFDWLEDPLRTMFQFKKLTVNG